MSRRNAPATERNREPILAVLEDTLPRRGAVVEIAAGTGQHAAFFASKLPGLSWLATDADPDALESIRAWTSGVTNCRPPAVLNVLAPWVLPADLEDVRAVLCVNMIHISPWEATEALMAGAGGILGAGGVLLTYGPYRIDGQQTAESNERFELWLKSLDPRFGVRDVADVAARATRHGLDLERRIDMPSNNFMLVFRRRALQEPGT